MGQQPFYTFKICTYIYSHLYIFTYIYGKLGAYPRKRRTNERTDEHRFGVRAIGATFHLKAIHHNVCTVLYLYCVLYAPWPLPTFSSPRGPRRKLVVGSGTGSTSSRICQPSFGSGRSYCSLARLRRSPLKVAQVTCD